MKTSTFWILLGLYILMGRIAQAQCPAVSGLTPFNITSTSVEIAASFSAAGASNYTVSCTPAGSGAAQFVTVSGGPVAFANLAPNTTYAVRVVTNCANGQTSAPAVSSFVTPPPPPPAPVNDNCATALVLPETADCASPTTGSVYGATPSALTTSPCFSSQRPGRDVWYRFVASGSTQILTATTAFVAGLDVWAGPCPAVTNTAPALYCTSIGQQVPNSGGSRTTQLSGLTAGQSYYVRVYPFDGELGAAGAAGAFTLCLTPGPSVPANDECTAAAELVVLGPTCSASVAGTVIGATASAVPASSGGEPTGVRDVWYRFTATNPVQTLELEALRPTDQGTRFRAEIFRNGCATPLRQASGSNTPTSSANGTSYSPGVITASIFVPGEVYLVRVFAVDSDALLDPTGRFNLCIKGQVPCPTPTPVLVVPNGGSAQLLWQVAGTAPPAYTLEYGLSGFAPGTGTRRTVTGNTATLTGLRTNTAYCYYVRSDCGGSQGSSSFTGPFCFQTGPAPAACTPPTSQRADGIGNTFATAVWQATTVAGTAFEIEYGPQGFTPGTGSLLTGVVAGAQITGLQASTDYCFYVRRDCGDFVGPTCFRTTGPAVLPDLVVNSAQTLAGGSYRNVTVTQTGTLLLEGDLAVAGALVVQAGGRLQAGRPRTALAPAVNATLLGAGSVQVQDGATLNIFSPQGLSTTGSTGTVQVQGTRTFSPGATYTYENEGVAPLAFTGAGLPSTVRNLRVGALGLPVTLHLSQPVAVREVLAIVGAGSSLLTNGQALTLLSDANGTALLHNAGGQVTGAGTMQRYIGANPAANGYRHYSSPVECETLATLAAPGYVPNFAGAAAYNSSSRPSLVTPFPTVFAYDQDRIATTISDYGPFDKGWVAPTSGTEPMEGGRGYAVQLPGSALVDFTGTFRSGNFTRSSLNRSGTDGGWHLLGNPYPSPLDWSTLSQGPGSSLDNLDGAVYLFQSSGPYAGTYRVYLNGFGDPLVPAGAGFFVRTSTPGTAGTLRLTNANRVTTFGPQPVFGRGSADTRPQLTLTLEETTGQRTDQATLYAEAGATPETDPDYDATKLANPTGLNLTLLTPNGAALAIDGRPTFAAGIRIPIQISVPAAGQYRLSATVAHLPASLAAYLHDASTGQQVNAATQSLTVQMPMGQNSRFSVLFAPAGVLATAPALTAAQVLIYPNPTNGAASVQVSMPVTAHRARATLINTLGQTVQTTDLSVQAGFARGTLRTVGLVAGVYTLRLQTGSTVVNRRLVIED